MQEDCTFQWHTVLCSVNHYIFLFFEKKIFKVYWKNHLYYYKYTQKHTYPGLHADNQKKFPFFYPDKKGLNNMMLKFDCQFSYSSSVPPCSVLSCSIFTGMLDFLGFFFGIESHVSQR